MMDTKAVAVTARLPEVLRVGSTPVIDGGGDVLTTTCGAAVLVLVLLAEGGSPGELLGVLLPEVGCTAELGDGLGVTKRAQDPAVLAVTPPVLQHVQDAQDDPSCTALAAQQQPPRHRFVPQSNALLQDSPGE